MAEKITRIESNRFVNICVSELEQEDRDRVVGYQDLPVTSLEEVVESITEFVPCLRDYVDTAKQFCRHNTELTPNESAAVYLYTMISPFYKKLNEVLRAQNPYAIKPWLAYLQLFFTAVEKIHSCSATVWRGVHGIIDSGFNEGEVHTWFSVNSCTRNVDVAGMFGAEIGTLFCIETIHAKDITMYSANQCEEEVLLLPGIRLRVKGKRSDLNGVPILHLQEW